MNIKELERTLIDQIEKLNDDSLAENEAECRAMVERSNAMSGLTNAYIGIQRRQYTKNKRRINNNGNMADAGI